MRNRCRADGVAPERVELGELVQVAVADGKHLGDRAVGLAGHRISSVATRGLGRQPGDGTLARSRRVYSCRGSSITSVTTQHVVSSCCTAGTEACVAP